MHRGGRRCDQGERQVSTRQLHYDGVEGGYPRVVVVIAGPATDTEDAAWEIVQDAVEMATARLQRDPIDVE
jgi:uncharacterized protein YciI